MCQYTPDNKRTKSTNQTKMCAIMVFYVYFVLYIELLFGNVGLNGSLENYITARQGYFGTSGASSSWIQASDYPQKYQYAYKFPDVDGYKFLIGFTNIRWTNSDKYYDYMLRNYMLNTQSDKVEMYSGQGTPDCVMYFFGLYIKS